MITTTHSPAAPDRSRVRGFTLVELMISAALASFLLLAVLTSFVFLGRTGVNMQSYTDMEIQARRAIETFAEDVRMAKEATWISKDSLTLTVKTVSGSSDSTITYTYNSTAGTFNRTVGTSTRTLVTGIASFSFTAYKINTATIDLSDSSTLATASSLTKQVQISLRSVRSNQTVVDATNSVISARFILRNKRVTA